MLTPLTLFGWLWSLGIAVRRVLLAQRATRALVAEPAPALARRIAIVAGLFTVTLLVAHGVADASTTPGGGGGGVLPTGGNGDLSAILKEFGISTNFNLMDLVSFLLKPVAIYYILHGVFDAHESWRQTGYKPKEFTHAVVGAGGTGLLIGGGAAIASTTIGASGALFF